MGELAALVRRPSGLVERRELPALDMAGAIERGWHAAPDGRLMLPDEPRIPGHLPHAGLGRPPGAQPTQPR